MAKRCTRCGNFLMDDERFCTRCGENVSNVPPQNTQYAQGTPQQSSYPNASGQTPQQQYTYAPPPPVMGPVAQQEEMSLGKWVGTIIVTTFFGLISLIFLFVWGFGDGPESRKRYCKAMLIVEAISIGLAIILMIVFGGIIGIMGSALSDYIQRYERYSGQGLAAFMQMFGM